MVVFNEVESQERIVLPLTRKIVHVDNIYQEDEIFSTLKECALPALR